MDSVTAKGMPDGYAVVTAMIQVKDRDELTTVIKRLNQISGVMSVKRPGDMEGV